MATFPTITQSGGGPQLWINSGGGITNHEAFAFTLQSTAANIGAYISDISVYLNTDYVAAQVSYLVGLSAVDENFNPSSATLTGNFESNGV